MKTRNNTPIVLLLVGVTLFAMFGKALALDNWERGFDQYRGSSLNPSTSSLTINCSSASCHNINPALAGVNSQGNLNGAPALILLRRDANIIQTRINNSTLLMGDTREKFGKTDGTIHDTVSDISAYLKKLDFPRATLTPVTNTDFGQNSRGLASNRKFKIENLGTAELDVTAISLSDSAFKPPSPNPCSKVAANSSCEFDVAFSPTEEKIYSAVLTITTTAYGSTRTISVSGEGLPPFTRTPLSLTFPGTTDTISIVDNKGDRLLICRQDADTFSARTDFELRAPFALGTNETCVRIEESSTKPRAINLSVVFTAGAPGPRNGKLSIQRVDANNNPLVDDPNLDKMLFVDLYGNPGKFVEFNESTLFLGDRGADVDKGQLVASLTLINKGSEPLDFTKANTFQISGASAADYELLPTQPTDCRQLSGLGESNGVVQPSCSLTVKFAPKSPINDPSGVEVRNAELTISIDGLRPQQISLRGKAIRGPRLVANRNGAPVASGDAIAFGPQTIGGLYASIDISLGNGGALDALEIVLPSLGPATSFSYAAGTACAVIAPAGTCTVNLRFDPSAESAYASPFVIRARKAGTSADYDEFALNLTGQGTVKAVPILRWTDLAGTTISRVDFEDTDAGAPSTSSVRLHNAGPGGATLNLANVVGLEGKNFVILDTDDCKSGQALYENMGCTLAIQFAPGTPGLKTATVHVTSSGSGPGPLMVSGRGIAASPAAQLSVVPSPTFDVTAAGSRSAPSEMTLSNNGNFALTVQAIEAEGPFAIESRSCPPTPFVLAAGTGCTISATFVPSAAGAATGMLRVITDATNSPTELPLAADAREAPDLSNGGCSMVQGDGPTDPTLWTLVLLAAAVLVYRRIDAMRRQGRAAPKRDE